MKLKDVVRDRAIWEEKGYSVFSYDRGRMIRTTRNEPSWVHFGSGNLFRAFQAVFCDELLERGLTQTGVIAVSGRDASIMDTYYRPMDDLHIAVTLKKDGSVEKRVIGSVAESLRIDDTARLEEIFRSPSLQVITFTITEKGYRVRPDDPDLSRTPEEAEGYLGRVAALLYERYRAGALPLTVCSNDNCSHNGDILRDGILTYASAWQDEGFWDYLNTAVSFPISMIDRITPRPDSGVSQMLRSDGVEEVDLLPSDHYMNCFVNTEETAYLVIEDRFANGRPLWDLAGVLFTDRDTVDRTEKMKVGTCLNPLHTTLAVFGCLLGYDRIWREMEDPDLVRLIRHVGYDEGLPVVTDPGILSPEEFLRTVLEIRLPNPFMPDMPQRIGMDTSQKIPVRFGETLKAYQKKGQDLSRLTYIPFVFAGWLRYLTGTDDCGERFEIPSDPLLPELTGIMGGYTLGSLPSEEELAPLLRRSDLFGVDLVETGLSGKVTAALGQMLEGPGAVRRALEELK